MEIETKEENGIFTKIATVTMGFIFAAVSIIFCLFLYVGMISSVDAGTCSSISRTNNTANSVLTSTKLNTDFNQLVTTVNALDAGCLTDATLEKGALNTSEFSAPLNGITEGCVVTRSDANTLSVDKCIASVNGNFIKTTSANTVTWGCSGCSAESSSTATVYYLYIKTGSTGTTLNLLISTVAPNADGYDAGGDKVIAKFLNDAANDIQTSSIQNYGPKGLDALTPRTTGTAVASPRFYFADVNCDAGSALAGSTFNGTATIGNVSSGICVITIPADNFSSIGRTYCNISTTNTGGDEILSMVYTSTTSISVKCITSGGGACSAFNGRLMCIEAMN